VRDYKVASGGSERLNTVSPLNSKTRSLSIDNFTLGVEDILDDQPLPVTIGHIAAAKELLVQ
jgi:hypothetical protein